MVNLGSAYGEIQIGTGGAEQSVQGLADKLRGIGGAMSLALTAPLVGLAAAGAMATADFEQNLNVLAQVAGATADQMALLEKQALDLGATTTFSAGQAAEAQLELAKAGMDVNQVMDAVPGVMALAAAGGVNLAEAARVTTGALNAFGLEAKSAGEIANLMAAAANASSADIADLSLGFQQASFAFSTTRQGADDLAASLAILTNVGLKGSDAGTALKNALFRLMVPTDDAAKLMRRLGIDFHDAQGTMLPMPDIIQVLSDATANMTDKEREATLGTIFLSDGMKAMIPLIDAGREGFLAMRDEVNTAGAAEAVAAARTQGLAGAIEYIRGSIESALITAFLPFTDAASAMIRQVADLVTMFANLPEPVRNAALAFAAVLAVAGPVMLAISGIGAVLGFLLSPIGLIVIGVAALAAAWTSNFMGIQEATAAAWGVIGPVLAQVVDGFTNYALSVADAGLGSIEAAESISLLPAALQPVAMAVDAAAAAFQEGWGVVVPQVIATVQAAWDALMGLLEPALSRLTAAFAGVPAQLGPLQGAFGELVEAVGSALAAMQPILEIFGQVIAATFAVLAVVAVNDFAAVIQAVIPTVTIIVNQLTVMINLLATVIQNLVTLVVAVFAGDWKLAWESAENIGQAFVDAFGATLENLGALVSTVMGVIYEVVVNTLTDMGVDTEGIMTGISTWWTSIWNGLTEKVQPVIDMIAEFRKALEGFAEWVTGFSIPNPFDGWSMPSLPSWAGGPPEPGTNARGTSYWPGGLSWVGERGPELVDLPRGARVFDAQESQRMGGRTFNITVPVQNVGGQLDMVELAHRVAGVIMGYEGA